MNLAGMLPPRLPFLARWLHRLLAAVGSLQLAVVLIAACVFVLAWGTLIESRHGAAASHREIYDTLWFAILCGLLAVNVLGAMLLRWPWKRRHTGFLMTHAGIVVLLVGCLVSRQKGIESQMPIVEGRTAHQTFVESAAQEPEAMDLGFQIHLHKFRRKLDPGASMASHYSSRVDVLDRETPPQVLSKDLLITLNAPVDVADPRSGRVYRLFQSSFRGPWLPGDSEFDKHTQGDRRRDHLYLSQLSVNYDPGRGLKYLGSLMVVAGILIVYYFRSYFVGPSRVGAIMFAALFCAGDIGVCRADEAAQLDLRPWRLLPVFVEGRVAPLETFAEETVAAICGRSDPTLTLPGETPRKYDAPELLLGWLVEPEKWENVSFLAASDETLRSVVLGLPLDDSDGRRLRFASPKEIENNEGLSHRWADLQQRAQNDPRFRPAGIDGQIKKLVDAYVLFRSLTADADDPKMAPRRFVDRMRAASAAWSKLAADAAMARHVHEDADVRRWMVEAGGAIQKLIDLLHQGEFSREAIEKPALAFAQSAESIAARLGRSDDKPLAALALDMERQTTEMLLAIHDNGETLRCVPALNPGALEENRTPDDDASPWLSFQAMISGSSDLMRAYPQVELKAVRGAWSDVRKAYLQRDAADRPAQFAEAMSRFAASVRQLGEEIDRRRVKLRLLHADEDAVAATAYPPPHSTNVEVFYNRLDPFFWAWVLSLLATLCLLLAVGPMRRLLFWLGMSILAAAQVMTVAGFGMRMYLTGLVPLTGMFESVVFVALCVAILGISYTLLPLLEPGLRHAWRLTGLPDRADHAAQTTRITRIFLLAVESLMMLGVLYALARYPGWTDWGLFDLLPPIAIGAAAPSFNEILVWLTGLCVLAAAVYYVPRGALAGLLAVCTVPASLRREGYAAGMEQALRRRLFVFAGALVSFLAIVLACHAPAHIMHRGIGSVAPILRDNFWLVVHVVTVIASYGAAAIALILGNIALGYYLLGHYSAGPDGRPRPPEACSDLAGFTYVAIRITVLLLAAGTILGALWADKSWGRFWGWDPKEVWALISLLVYALLLHTRYLGWSGDFGLCVAAVLGATSILFTWYGVNFILGSGMHAYASGSGGQWVVVGAVAANWLFMTGAAVRYLLETERAGNAA